MKRKLGLKLPQAQPTLRLRDYYTSDLPTADSLTFPLGHAAAIQPQMFLNDQLGDCAIAGSIEEVRLANALRGVTVNFTDQTALQNYSAITGYNPNDPSTDQGTDVHELYEYRKATGIVDADGNAHKIVAYAGLTAGDPDEMLVAIAAGFDIGAIGIQVTDYFEGQFEAGEPFHLIPGNHTIVGGHYVPIVGATDRNTLQLYTWGALATMEAAYYSTYGLVAVVALTEEMFTGDKSPEGIDFDKLAADIPELNTGQVSAKAPKRSAARSEPAI